MSKHSRRRFRYSVDIHHDDGTWGCYGFREFSDGGEALRFVENLADVNREIAVSLNIHPLGRAKWPRKAS